MTTMVHDHASPLPNQIKCSSELDEALPKPDQAEVIEVTIEDSNLQEINHEGREVEREEERESREQEHEHEQREENDDDSGFGSDNYSITTSIKPSTNGSEMIMGREYETSGEYKYYGPKDEIAQDAQDLSHHVWLMVAEGRLSKAPIQSFQNILDLGTGTGIWANDVADIYPSVNIRGTDISPIQASWVPQGVENVVDDFNHLDFEPTMSYDMVHIRELFGSVRSWPGLLERCYKILNDGGWLEIQEPDINLTIAGGGEIDAALREWSQLLIEIGTQNGMSFDVVSNLKAWCEAAGFDDIKVEIKTVPIGGETDLGKYNQLRLKDAVDNYSLRHFVEVLKWDAPKIHTSLVSVRRALMYPSPGLSQKFYFVTCQKAFQEVES